jgi:SAM-dependent methyltransferase
MSISALKPTREDVENLCRLLLGRAPESEHSVNNWLTNAPNLKWLVERFLESDEFRNKHPNLSGYVRHLVDTSKLKVLIEELASRHPKRELYQPVFGVKVDHGGPVQRECVGRCRLILHTLSSMPIQNMSVLDVGCNMGFVSLYMSEHFARVTGIEYDEVLFNFCVELNRLHDKNVVFKKEDFFADYSSLSGQYDICLLFSVIHYLVANKGLAEAKSTLNDIVSRFDFTFIELSSSKDYSYMPEDPAELLSGLADVDITLLGLSEKNERPIYLLKRRLVTVDETLPIDSVLYPAPLATSCARLYFSGYKVVKYLPSNFLDNQKKYENEIAAYGILSDVPFVPQIYGSRRVEGGAWICIERITGIPLNHLYLSSDLNRFESNHDRMVLACKLLLALREMVARGLYWNDLSAHNLMIFDGELYLYDFGESGSSELNDHVVMLSWILYDLQKEEPASYKSDIYDQIHAAGGNKSYSRRLKFEAPHGFFTPELEWIYSIVSNFDSIYDLLKINTEILEKIKLAASGRIRLSEDFGQYHNVDRGLLSWSTIPSPCVLDEVTNSTFGFNGNEGLPEFYLPSLTLDARQCDLNIRPGYQTFLERKFHTHKGTYSTENNEWDRERRKAKEYTDSLIDRASRAEAYSQSLLDEIAKLKMALAKEQAARETQRLDALRQVEAQAERAYRAETYNQSLLTQLDDLRGGSSGETRR